MHEFLTILGILLTAMALRSCRRRLLRKLGAFVFLLVSGLIVYFLTASLPLAIASLFLWFFLPWIELASRIRKLRLPTKNRLHEESRPRLQHFPEASHNINELHELDFEHCSDYSWDWAESSHHYSFYWHPEQRAVITISLCKQANISFSYLTITSRDQHGKIYKSSNFPFSPTLKPHPDVDCNQLTCTRCPLAISLENHQQFIEKSGTKIPDLMLPDPDSFYEEVENEMHQQIEHNLQSGIITLTGDGKFRYSFRGLCFLWKQFVIDMIRLS